MVILAMTPAAASAGTPYDDRIDGGRGRDVIRGGDGNDRIDGGRGRDLLDAGDGDDRIDSRDGMRDSVRCGTGRDVVVGDRTDRLSGCERPHLGELTAAAGSAAAANLVLQRLELPAPADARELQARFAQIEQHQHMLRTDTAAVTEALLRNHVDERTRGFVQSFVTAVEEAQRRLRDMSDPASATPLEGRADYFKDWMRGSRLEQRLVQFEDQAAKPGGLLDVASRAAAERDVFFFTQQDSLRARAVYDHYALLQALALGAILEHWRLTSGDDPNLPYNDPAYVDQFRLEHTRRIQSQARRLKPPLPPQSLLQKRTGIVWRHLPETSVEFLGEMLYAPTVLSRGAAEAPHLTTFSYAGREYHFGLPTEDEFDQLVRDGATAGPGRWLVRHGFPEWLFHTRSDQAPADGLFWTSAGESTRWVVPWSDRYPGGPQSAGPRERLIPLWRLAVNPGDFAH